MLITPHALTGAVIGRYGYSLTTSLMIVYFLGLLSHYALDRVPHWDIIIGRGWYQETGIFFSWRTYIQAFLDILLAVILVWPFLNRQVAPMAKKLMLAGIVGAITPDFLDNLPMVGELTGQIPILAQQQEIHRVAHITADAQRHLWPYTGLVTQLVVIAVMFWLLRRPIKSTLDQ